MQKISYVPKVEINRVMQLKIDANKKAQLLADICRINALYMVTKAGSGHIGTSFSCLDIISLLHLTELNEDDLLFSSKGHDAPGFYALGLAMGKIEFEKIHQLRRLGGLPGHPNVGTPTVVANTGSLGMGIAKAKGMIHANRLNGKKGRVFIILGDGELQEGQNWESLTSAVRYKMGELTAIVDKNQIQSDTWTKDVSDLGNLVDKFRAFGWEVATCNGHDFEQMAKIFAKLREIKDKPKMLVAETLKGKGVSFMEPAAMDPVEKMYKFHSGAPSQENYEKGLGELLTSSNALLKEIGAAEIQTESLERVYLPVPKEPQRLIKAYSEAIVAQGEKNQKLVVLDADLVLDCGLVPFSKRFPERFFECGIAEQDMVSTAGGMALNGLIPVVHSFACFLAPRPNEQIYNNATERTKIVYVGSLAGLVPGGPGHSHQSVRDISILSATPGMVMIEPSCEAEVALALDYCVNTHSGSSYIRLISIPVETQFSLPSGYKLQEGCGVAVRQGSGIAIIAYGPVLLGEACKAADHLAAKGQGPTVYNLPWLNRVNDTWLKDVLKSHSTVILLDNHFEIGGQSQMIAAKIAEYQLSKTPKVIRKGLDRIPDCGANHQVLESHKFDASALIELVKSLS